MKTYKMKKIRISTGFVFDIYILRQQISPFLLSLFVYTFVLIMNRLFELVDLIFGKGLNPLMVGEIFLYSLPFILAITAPMAFLTSILSIFGRMSEDFEIIAYKALGLNPFRLLLPLGFAALVFAFFMVYFNNYILPESNHRVKNLLLVVGEIRPAAELAPRSFIKSFPGYTIYARAIDKTSRPAKLEDVLLIENTDYATFGYVTARQAFISIDREWNLISFEMIEGQRHISGENGDYWEVDFERQILNVFLPPDARPDTAFRGDRELSAAEMMTYINNWKGDVDSLEKFLLTIIESEDEIILQEDMLEHRIAGVNMQIRTVKSEINRYLVEVHKKYSLPFAAITFIFLGAPLGIKVKKGGMGAAFGVAILITTIYYIFIVGGETLSDRGVITPFWSMWSANIIFFIIGIWFYYDFFHDGLKFWKK